MSEDCAAAWSKLVGHTIVTAVGPSLAVSAGIVCANETESCAGATVRGSTILALQARLTIEAATAADGLDGTLPVFGVGIGLLDASHDADGDKETCRQRLESFHFQFLARGWLLVRLLEQAAV